MTFIGWRGDPCTRCQDEQRQHVQRATHHGLCSRCWAGSTELQRRSALFDEAAQDAPVILTADAALRAWAEAA